MGYVTTENILRNKIRQLQQEEERLTDRLNYVQGQIVSFKEHLQICVTQNNNQ